MSFIIVLVDVTYTLIARPVTVCRCGLVALCMAGQLLGSTAVSVDDILAKARYLGFTNNGEMFSGTYFT